MAHPSPHLVQQFYARTHGPGTITAKAGANDDNRGEARAIGAAIDAAACRAVERLLLPRAVPAVPGLIPRKVRR